MSEKTEVYKLAEPLKIGGQTYTEIRFRRPKARDIRLMAQGGDSEEVFRLVINLTELPAETIEELPAGEYLGLVSAITPFLEAPQRTSKS